MGSEAYKDDYIIYECYDGKLVAMSPRPLTYHNNVAKHLYDIFFLKLMDKNWRTIIQELHPKKMRFVKHY